MAVKAVVVAVPSNGTVVPITDEDGDVVVGNHMGFRNTGTVDLLLGGESSALFPLKVDEFYGAECGPEDTFYVKVKTNGTAGEITAVKSK
jgi:hypothetical protein